MKRLDWDLVAQYSAPQLQEPSAMTRQRLIEMGAIRPATGELCRCRTPATYSIDDAGLDAAALEIFDEAWDARELDGRITQAEPRIAQRLAGLRDRHGMH